MALERMSGGVPPARLAQLRTIKHPYTDDIIDEALVLYFQGPASFTGEDVAEFHLHGGRAVVDCCLAALGALEGTRLAEPGEFTRRAFDNGKLDLTQVEGLADLIAAQTDAQRRQALRVASGEAGAIFNGWRDQLIYCLAFLEADIDFVEEDDVPEDLPVQVIDNLQKLYGEISGYLDDPRQSEKLREGFRVAIAGIPNVGKSSLLNRLAMRDVAIVSDIAGTTRDVVEIYFDLAGLPVVLSDTAGLRDTADEIEYMGVVRAQKAISDADLVIWLADDRGIWPPESLNKFDSDALWVLNKADLAETRSISGPQSQSVLAVSAKDGSGLRELLDELTEKAQNSLDGVESALITRRRHREAMEQCRKYLAAGLNGLQSGAYESELVAENVRLAARMLGRITGRIDVEDLLDTIFSSFCVGK